jgi:hypothetical protein
MLPRRDQSDEETLVAMAEAELYWMRFFVAKSAPQNDEQR